ncbi:hypothetical protein CC77DRAFT_322813 [Alternaria alternata]|uniref:Uncharacterized protein n=1 Tax=Alternaria alternata TaxID=5599 RepID=A0A177E0E4_ALTAL|nr:hypothetical protein CC77DRAFT_322813 [Alternaria alternata]OAG25445.1 hypothetical protein CC77DRAFT_322813 [Alternaria alternata]
MTVIVHGSLTGERPLVVSFHLHSLILDPRMLLSDCTVPDGCASERVTARSAAQPRLFLMGAFSPSASTPTISASLVSYGVSGTDCTLLTLNLNIHESHSQVKFHYQFRVTHITLVCWADICCDKFFRSRRTIAFTSDKLTGYTPRLTLCPTGRRHIRYPKIRGRVIGGARPDRCVTIM